MTIIEIEGVENFRDVGGIAAANGRVRSGRLFRSAQLSGLSERGTSQISSLVRSIIDLRTDEEVAAAKTTVPKAQITRVPLYPGSTASFFLEDFTLEDLYCQLLEDAAILLVDALRVISRGEPTLVHCRAGKDRTGLTIALALAAVDADREPIVADYALSGDLISAEQRAATVERLRQKYPDSTNAGALATDSPTEVMREILASIDEAWGSTAGYLSSHGFTSQELAALRSALLETELTPQGAVV